MPRTTPEFQRTLNKYQRESQASTKKRCRLVVSVPTTVERAEAAQLYTRLPSCRRARIISYLRDEAVQQNKIAAQCLADARRLAKNIAISLVQQRDPGAIARMREQRQGELVEAREAREWAEENRAALAVLQMYCPTKIAKLKKKEE